VIAHRRAGGFASRSLHTASGSSGACHSTALRIAISVAPTASASAPSATRPSTARKQTLGLTAPQKLLANADEVIE